MKTFVSIFIILITIVNGYGQEKRKRPIAQENGKFFEQDGKKMLYGGEKATQHFIIDNLDLKYEQFHYGLGRERFPALLTPEFESIADADKHWDNENRFLVGYKNNEVKAYSIKDLTRHEVVNDVLGGEPIFAAYCILADLGAIYKRTYDDKIFTFAVSGYTYFDPKIWDGLDGFILWDRETESLWWPLIDKSVSGALKGVKLLKLENSNWEDTTWGKLKKKYPKAMVMKPNQDYERPKEWKKYLDVSAIVKRYTN